ncbi:MAG: LamG-like jellyroll fold domain-containing protein [Candidatus Paceibacterota bacterium]|jgi:hypothetical protein
MIKQVASSPIRNIATVRHAVGNEFYDYELCSLCSYSPENVGQKSIVLDLASPLTNPNVKTKIFDKSPYGNHAAITGATWVRLPSGLYVLSYDGIDDKAIVASPVGMTWGTGDYTLMSWVYLTAYTTPDADIASEIICANHSNYSTTKGAPAWGLAFYTDDHGTPASRRKFLFFGRSSLEDYKSVLTTRTHVINTWYLVAGKRESGVCKISVNGGAFESGDSGADMNATQPAPLAIGISSHNQTSFGFNGKLSPIKVFNVALSDAYVASLFNTERWQFGV